MRAAHVCAPWTHNLLQRPICEAHTDASARALLNQSAFGSSSFCGVRRMVMITYT